MNRFRDAFGFGGTPVRLIFRQRGNAAGKAKNIEARKRRKAQDRKKGVRPKKPRGGR
jgi:hypothetical protein